VGEQASCYWYSEYNEWSYPAAAMGHFQQWPLHVLEAGVFFRFNFIQGRLSEQFNSTYIILPEGRRIPISDVEIF